MFRRISYSLVGKDGQHRIHPQVYFIRQEIIWAVASQHVLYVCKSSILLN
jgi:hypothetical protein